jgi:outer membrane protein assembly factor BamB
MTTTRRFGVMLVAMLTLMAWTGVNRMAVAQKQAELPKDEAKKGEPKKDADEDRGDFAEGLSLPTDSEARRLIQAAKDYASSKDWNTVCDCLQGLLENREDSFLRVKRKKPDGTDYSSRVSIRTEANRLISGLPAEGLEIYKQRFGQKAQQMLREGIERNDPQVLADVATRYRYTEAGAEAGELLGIYYLDRGRHVEATEYFKQVIDRLAQDKPEIQKQHGPRIHFLAALAAKRNGDNALSERYWARLTELTGDDGLKVGKQSYPIEQLRKELDRDARIGVLAQTGYPYYRGNLSRTAQNVGGTPFLEPRWEWAMVPSEEPSSGTSPDYSRAIKWVTDKVNYALKQADQGSQRRPALPTFFPVAANGKIIFRTFDGVSAYYLRDNPAEGGKAGELAWKSDTKAGLFNLAQSNLTTVEQWWQLYTNSGGAAAAMLTSLLFENAQVGTLSHDNQCVYFVDDIGIHPHPQLTIQMAMGGQQNQGPFKDFVETGRLCAVEIASGKLMWQIGHRSMKTRGNNGGAPAVGGAAPGAPAASSVNPVDDLDEAYFLGPPLPLGGKLYLMIELNGELRLVCMDPSRYEASRVEPFEKAPAILWMQPIGNANNRLASDILRRVNPVHLAYSDGVLVCPTNAGAVIGVHLLSRSLLWAHSYRAAKATPADPGAPNPFGGPFRGRGGRFRGGDVEMLTSLNQERWRTSAPAVVNGRIVFTAHDSTSVQCLRLTDGELLWEVPRAESDLFMAGVYNGKVLVVGKEKIRALDLMNNGKVVWETAVGLASGQGSATKDHYYLPLKRGIDSKEPLVCAIDINTGRIVSQTKARKGDAPGNLVFFEGDVFSQSAMTVSAFPQLDIKRAEMDKLLAKNPNDPVGLTERGELLLDQGRLEAAIADLKKALENRPPETVRHKARTKLYDALTTLVQDQFAKAEEHLDLYKDLCETDLTGADRTKRLSKFFVLVGTGRESQGKLVAAFEAYTAFGSLNGNEELVSVPDQPGTLVRPDVFARGRIAAMLAKASPEQRKPLENLIADRWAEVKKSNDLDKLRGFVKMFGTLSSTGREARLLLAERLIAGNEAEQLDAQVQLYELSALREDPATAARAVDALARLMIRKGQLEDAVAFYRRLGEEFANVKVRDGKTGAELFNELFTDKRFLPYLEPDRPGMVGKFRFNEQLGPHAIDGSRFTFLPEGDLLPFFRRHDLIFETTGTFWTFRLISKDGRSRMAVSGIPANPYLVQPPQPGASPVAIRFAQARGHLLVMTLNHFVYAVDLADRKVLWKYDLQGKVFAGNQSSSSIPDGEGGMTLHYSDNERHRVVMAGVMESNSVCLMTRDGLVAIDLTTGKEIWRRASGVVAANSKVFASADHFFVQEFSLNGTAGATYAFRTVDGMKIEIPDFGPLLQPQRRLGIVNGRILAFDDDADGSKILRLYDPLTGEDTWRQPFPAGTKAAFNDEERHIGLVEPSGIVHILDAKSRRTLLKVTDPNNRIESAHLDNVKETALLVDRDNYYLVLNRPIDGGTSLAPAFGYGVRSIRLNGTCYTFDRSTGDVWHTGQVNNQMIVLDRFRELPLLVCAVNRGSTNRVGTTPGVAIEVFDKRSGKSLLPAKMYSANGIFQPIHFDRESGLVELTRHDIKIQFAPEGSDAARSFSDSSAGRTDAPQAPHIRPGIQIIRPVIRPAPPKPPQ